MVLGLKSVGKPTTSEKTKVLNRTKALYGSRTQAYGETNYLKEKTKVLDTIWTLYDPQALSHGGVTH